MATPKRRRLSSTPPLPPPPYAPFVSPPSSLAVPPADDDEDSTDTKLALLLSLHPTLSLSTALETLLAAAGSVELASELLSPESLGPTAVTPKKAAVRQQASLADFLKPTTSSTTSATPSATPASAPPRGPKKGQTLHLYTPATIALHTPCLLHPRFLPAPLATTLLHELLAASSTFPPPPPFTLFDRTVTSPHTAGFFLRTGTTPHVYQARSLAARPFTPAMEAVTELVEATVNEILDARERRWGMMRGQWSCNAALVNRYQGAKEGVGWHADDPTYLGPMAAIASLSLGVEREFRVRRAYGRDGRDADDGGGEDDTKPGASSSKEYKEGRGTGQYALHLPHNSLLVMLPGMQEEWKHSVHPARRVDVHPVAGEVRINVTYRCYRPSLRPAVSPRCACVSDGVGAYGGYRAVTDVGKVGEDGERKEGKEGKEKLPMILRSVFGPSSGENGERRYFWQCAGGYREGAAGGSGGSGGCGRFRWMRFDRWGEPVWEPGDPGYGEGGEEGDGEGDEGEEGKEEKEEKEDVGEVI